MKDQDQEKPASKNHGRLIEPEPREPSERRIIPRSLSNLASTTGIVTNLLGEEAIANTASGRFG
jgi:hypothetical protein